MKRLAEVLMKLAEIAFLRLHGWTTVVEFDQTYWIPPPKYEWEKKIGKPHRRGHAVNSQKAAIGNKRHLESMAKHYEDQRQEDPLDEG